MFGLICNTLIGGTCNLLSALLTRSCLICECFVGWCMIDNAREKCNANTHAAQDKCTDGFNSAKVNAALCWEGLKTTIHNANPNYHEEALVEVGGENDLQPGVSHV